MAKRTILSTPIINITVRTNQSNYQFIRRLAFESGFSIAETLDTLLESIKIDKAKENELLEKMRRKREAAMDILVDEKCI